MIMRRFNKSDWMTFSGAMNLPSGEPLIANGIELPCADGNGSSGIEVSVLACCAHDDFIVEIHGCCESGCHHRASEGHGEELGQVLRIVFPNPPCSSVTRMLSFT